MLAETAQGVSKNAKQATSIQVALPPETSAGNRPGRNAMNDFSPCMHKVPAVPQGVDMPFELTYFHKSNYL